MITDFIFHSQFINLGPLVDILENEVKNRNKMDKRGRRYSDALKRLSITFHYASSTAYRIMRFPD